MSFDAFVVTQQERGSLPCLETLRRRGTGWKSRLICQYQNGETACMCPLSTWFEFCLFWSVDFRFVVRVLVFVCLTDCLSVCLSVSLSVCLFVCLSVSLSVCVPLCLSVCLSVYVSAFLFLCLPVCLSICLSVCLSVNTYLFKHELRYNSNNH